MKIKMLGATGGVTGSSYCVVSGRTNLLVDFGMFQGGEKNEERNYVKPSIDFRELAGVILTHAHLDHCGRLPLLVKYGFEGKIYMTEPTRALAELVLMDAAKIAEEDESKTALYGEDEVREVLLKTEIVEYEKDYQLGDVQFRYYDAGHILGSASVVIDDGKTQIAFSGDLGNTPEPLLQPTRFVKKADYAVVESTYGDEVHEKRNETEELAKIVETAEKENGTVLIPSFSLQRSQELLYIFDQLKKNGEMKAETMVFLDSPMAIKATNIFKDYPSLFSEALKKQVKTDDPFDFPGLRLCDSVEKSRQIKSMMGAKVIIAGSGMMNGGRILHHVITFLGEEKTQLVFVGYQAEGTLGREILDGASSVVVWRNKVEIRARIKEIKTMSSHADQLQLLKWLEKIDGLRGVVLTHGEEIPRLVLAEKVRQEISGVEVFVPSFEEELELV